jgi:hypothetical protein
VKAFTPANIIAGFQKTGIEPFNSSQFDCDEEFLAASVTDRPLHIDSIGGLLQQALYFVTQLTHFILSSISLI